MRIGTVYPDSEAYRGPSIQPYFFCCPGRSISWHHRCIALLYRIPLWIFNCVIMSNSSGAVYELVEGLPFWNIPIFRIGPEDRGGLSS